MMGKENIQGSKKIHRDLRGFWKFLCRSTEDPKWRCGTKMIRERAPGCGWIWIP